MKGQRTELHGEGEGEEISAERGSKEEPERRVGTKEGKRYVRRARRVRGKEGSSSRGDGEEEA